MSTEAPPKFVNENGVRKLNPAWKAWNTQQTGGAPPAVPAMLNADTALPVVTSVAEQQRQLVGTATTASVAASVEMLQDPDIAKQVGADPQQILAKLGQVFSKYEIPVGLLNKLMGLSEFEIIEMIVDDSGSMNAPTDAVDPRTNKPLTRWQEVFQRLTQMFETVAFVPCPPIIVRFLNRATTIDARHAPGEAPEVFLQRTMGQVSQAFAQPPAGTTPAAERIGESLGRYRGQAVLRYFFGDGVPNGGAQAAMKITQMLIHRPDPHRNPFTFLSCTNEDAAVEWMKECEEAAPFCAEFDDYADEAGEVLKDQGKAFPYTFGMHLVGQLVAAFNPNDLDAMDESAPFTKATLDNLQGWQCSVQEYDYYFNSFLEAQGRQPTQTPVDQFKKGYLNVWKQNIDAFRSAAQAKDIPAVQQFHHQLTEIKKRGG